MDTDTRREILEKSILHWNYRDLKKLPEELKEVGSHIKEIYLKYNYIERLPQWVGQLKNLTNLYLLGNQLMSLPDEIRELESLHCLDIEDNNLACLPAAVCKLSRLNILSASRNFLTCLPEEVRELQALKVLLLSGNMLSNLPDSLCECRNLEELCLDKNHLTSLPQRIVYLPKLDSLSVRGNQIFYLPALPFISHLRLFFEENPSLSYLGYCLGCQLSRHSEQDGNKWLLETYRCFESNVISELCYRNVILQTSRPFYHRSFVQLVMPEGLLTVGHPASHCRKVPSMYELSIRLVYQILSKHKLNIDEFNGQHVISMMYLPFNWNVLNALGFPQNIHKQLHKGPVTICNNPNCNTPIFTFAIVWIVPKLVITVANDPRQILSTIFFCSDHCSSECTVYNELQRSKIDWQETMQE